MKINLQLHEKHFERIARFRPINAIKEAIWNAYDADAKNIVIQLVREDRDLFDNPIISQVLIDDDGHGLHLNHTKEAFQEFGYSSKSNGNKKSPLGRKIHGDKGEGRYSLFSIGRKIEWESYYRDENKLKKLVANFSEENHGKTITIFQANEIPESTGLKIIIRNILNSAKKELERKNNVISELLKEFATCLFAYPEIKITYDGSNLDIKKSIIFKEKYSKIINKKSVEVTAIEWKEKVESAVFYCNEEKIPLGDNLINSKNNISVYISSEIISANSNELIFVDSGMLNEELRPIFEFLNECIENFEKKLISRNERGLIDSLKSDGVYPIGDEPVSIGEKYNKEAFDSVVIEINKRVPSIRNRAKKEQKLFNNLLYEAIKNNPSSLTKILSKVFDLSLEEQDEFAKLLVKLELSQIIKAVDAVTKRILFLEELYDLVYTDLGKGVKERTQFQQILGKELWIFGEQYAYSVVDRNIRNVLNEFASIFGRNNIEIGELADGELIPDICLFTTTPIGENQFEHLVIEIKRPTKILGQDELKQIKKYASRISSQTPFQNARHKWNFLLLGKSFDKDLSYEMESKIDGIVIENPNSTVRVLRWEEIIRNTKRQYKYFKNQLQLKITDEDVKQGINDKLSEVHNK